MKKKPERIEIPAQDLSGYLRGLPIQTLDDLGIPTDGWQAYPGEETVTKTVRTDSERKA